MTGEEGKCPKCGSEYLNYDCLVIESNGLKYPYDCEDCNFEGEEWYDLEFSTHLDKSGNTL